MEKYIVKEICKNLKWYEQVIVNMFAKLFIKVYNNERIKIINILLEK